MNKTCLSSYERVNTYITDEYAIWRVGFKIRPQTTLSIWAALLGLVSVSSDEVLNLVSVVHYYFTCGLSIVKGLFR